jgi:hypothetical protein
VNLAANENDENANSKTINTDSNNSNNNNGAGLNQPTQPAKSTTAQTKAKPPATPILTTRTATELYASRKWLPTGHTHSVMPGQAVPYLPSQSEFIFVLGLALSVVAFYLMQLLRPAGGPSAFGNSSGSGGLGLFDDGKLKSSV